MYIRISKILREFNITIDTFNDNFPNLACNINEKIFVDDYVKLKQKFISNVEIKKKITNEINFIRKKDEEKKQYQKSIEEKSYINPYLYYKEISTIILFNYFYNETFNLQISKLNFTKFSDDFFYKTNNIVENMIALYDILESKTDFVDKYDRVLVLGIDIHTKTFIFENKYLKRLYLKKNHPSVAVNKIGRLYTLYHEVADRINIRKIQNLKDGIIIETDEVKEYTFTTKSSVFAHPNPFRN